MTHRRRSKMTSSEYENQDEYFDVKQGIQEILSKLDDLLGGQEVMNHNLQIINAKENYQMAYNKEQFRELLRKSTTIRGAIRVMVQQLKATATEADFQEMADEVIANNADYEALIIENTPAAEVIDPATGGSTGGVGGSTGGA